MDHQETARPLEIAGIRSPSHLNEGGKIAAQRGEHVAIRGELDFDFTPAAEDPPEQRSASPCCVPQLAR